MRSRQPDGLMGNKKKKPFLFIYTFWLNGICFYLPVWACMCVCVSAHTRTSCSMTNRTVASKESGLNDYCGSTGEILGEVWQLICTVESHFLAFIHLLALLLSPPQFYKTINSSSVFGGFNIFLAVLKTSPSVLYFQSISWFVFLSDSSAKVKDWRLFTFCCLFNQMESAANDHHNKKISTFNAQTSLSNLQLFS